MALGYFVRGARGRVDFFPPDTVAGRTRDPRRRRLPRPPAENREQWPWPVRSCSSAMLLKRPLFPRRRRREKSSIRSPGRTSNSSSFASCTFETRRTKGRRVKLPRIQLASSPRLLLLRRLVLRSKTVHGNGAEFHRWQRTHRNIRQDRDREVHILSEILKGSASFQLAWFLVRKLEACAT